MFSLCSAMKWAHLPVAGGLYDQDPQLLEQFRYIFGEVAKQQEREQKKQEGNSQRGSKSGRGTPGRGTRRR